MIKFETANIQYMYKMLPLSSRLTASLSWAQLSTRLYDTVHSIQNSLRDTTMAVEVTKNKEGPHISMAHTPTSEDTVGVFDDVWYELTSQLGKYKTSVSFGKTFIKCDLTGDKICSCVCLNFCQFQNSPYRKSLSCLPLLQI